MIGVQAAISWAPGGLCGRAAGWCHKVHEGPEDPWCSPQRLPWVRFHYGSYVATQSSRLGYDSRAIFKANQWLYSRGFEPIGAERQNEAAQHLEALRVPLDPMEAVYELGGTDALGQFLDAWVPPPLPGCVIPLDYGGPKRCAPQVPLCR